jgi:hypothetical protein
MLKALIQFSAVLTVFRFHARDARFVRQRLPFQSGYQPTYRIKPAGTFIQFP